MTTPTAPWDLDRIREDFPALHQEVNGKPLVYLDNAATTHKPRPVIDAITTFYERDNANVHRAIYELGERATRAYEAARQKAADFISAPDWRSIVFTKGATEAINLVAYAWGRHNLRRGDEILVTEMEHHSNLIPWQLLARDTDAVLRYIPLRQDGTLQLDDVDDLLSEKTKIVAVVHKSNVFGTVNPVRQLARKAHDVGAVVLVDGAQSVPHIKVNVQDLECDFLAFSGHKMLGPTGVGVLFAHPEILEGMEPFHGGGEMISSVTMESSTWNDIPWRFEAGTPNIAQVIGLGAAIDYIRGLGIENIENYINELTAYARHTLADVPGMTIYGAAEAGGSAIPFNLGGIHPHDLAQILDQEGIAIRAGHHCAQPVMRCLGVSATNRASLYFYNRIDDIHRLVAGLETARKFMGL